MQGDSRCFSGKSGHLTSNQILHPSPPVQSYQCSHCVLIFESKLVLLEHLGEVHDLDVYNALRHATSSAVGDAGQNIKPKNDNLGDNCGSALQQEEQKSNIKPDILSKVNVNKEVVVEKSNSHIAKPTSKYKSVTKQARSVKVSQKSSSRKITQYFAASSVPNVKSPSLPCKVQATNTAKKTLIPRKSNPAPKLNIDCTFNSHSLPSELQIKLFTDRTKSVLDYSATEPPPKKPKHNLSKKESKLSLEFSSGEEDHKLPKDEMNHEEHHGSAGISPTKQKETNPAKLSLTSKAVQADLYRCDSCTFGHNSVVAMLVHYQRRHPKLGVTLDQIKQSRNVVSNTKPPLLPEMSSEYLNINTSNQDEKPMASSDKSASSDSSSKTKDKSKLPPEENISAVNPKDFPETPSQLQTAVADSSICNGSNPTLILSHQKTRHGRSPREVKWLDATEPGEAEKSSLICLTRVRKKSPTSAPLTPQKSDCAIEDSDVESCGGVEASASPNDGLKDKGDCEQKGVSCKLVGKWLICPICHYVNRSTGSILIHFRRRHPESPCKMTAKDISIYTASIQRRMYKSESESDSVRILSSGLPLPILQCEDMFFCHVCNYGHKVLTRVYDHQNEYHPEIRKDRSQVLAYTAEVYDQPREEQLKFEANQIVSVSPPSPVQSEFENVQTCLPGIPVSKKTKKTSCPFHCHKCPYTASNVHLLKRHLSERHLIHLKAAVVLRKAFDKGLLKEGYYCQWCSFSNKKAIKVHYHCKQIHKSQSISLNYISTHLHVGPKDAASKMPNNIEEVGHHEVPASFDNYEGPQELESSTLDYPSPNSYMCHFCAALFSTRRGLRIHYGMKHMDKLQSEPSNLDDNAEIPSDTKTSVNVLKCPWCRYVHTKNQGILSHCLKRHSTKKVIPQGFETVDACIPPDYKGKGQHSSKPRIGGYLCQLCKEVHHSLEKIKIHHKYQHENSGFPSVLKPAPKLTITKQLLSKYHGAQGSGSHHGAQGSGLQNTFLKKNQPGVKCPICKLVSKSNYAFAQHVKVCRGNRKMRHVFKCSECSYVTLLAKYLKKHCRIIHGTCSNTLAKVYTDVAYNCRLCPYLSSKSRYLISHYRKAHGRETPIVFKDNKSRRCKKCPRSFRSDHQLSIHYTSFHRRHIKMDFKVLHDSSKKSAGPRFTCHCSLKLKTIKELCCHLENHREQKMKTVKMSSVAVTSSIQCDGKGQSPMLQMSPSPKPEGEAEGAEAQTWACKHCGLGFTSLGDLRVHERSHEAGVALQQQQQQDAGPVAWSEDVFDSHTRFRPGIQKPFQCCTCGYRTNLMCLLKSHVMKKHMSPVTKSDAGNLPNLNAGLSESVEYEQSSPEAADEGPAAPPDQKDPSLSPQHATKTSKYSVYSEPAEVQRQLSHYRSMPLASSVPPPPPELPDDNLVHCEFCDFTSEHQSSVRRHYINIHGKKLLRCKDCSFFTGNSKTLDLHKEMGHSTCQMEPTHQKTLRCPLCLYHTKNQNHMIDHVILHRPERVVPIEVRRPKLSHYLQGVVFRCHECTFTSGSAANLRAHALKHNNVRPYQCRLCYFDCTRLSELEAHLCDKHQVARNHELVGQVNLDLLETRPGSHGPEGDEEGDEEDTGSNPREGKNEDEDVEAERCDDMHQREKPEGGDVDMTPRPGDDVQGEVQGPLLQPPHDGTGTGNEEEERQRDACDAKGPVVPENEGFQAVGSASDPRGKPENGVEEELAGGVSEPDHEGTMSDGTDGTACDEPGGAVCDEPDGTACDRPDGTACDGPDRTACNEPDRTACDGPDGTACNESDGTACNEHDRTVCDGPDGTACKEPDGTVCDGPDGTVCDGPEGTACHEPDRTACHEPDGTACDAPDGQAVSEDGQQNHKAVPYTEAEKSSPAAAEGQTAAHTTNCVTGTADVEQLDEPRLSSEAEQQAHRRESDDGLGVPDMPVLENVYHKQRNPVVAAATLRDASNDPPSEGAVNKGLIQDDEGGTEEAETLLSEGTPTDDAAALTTTTRPRAEDDRVFSCTLCGRNFSNRPELERHIKRHGM